MRLDPETQQALAESARRMNEGIARFAESMAAAMDSIAPRIADAAEQTRRNIVGALDKAKAP